MRKEIAKMKRDRKRRLSQSPDGSDETRSTEAMGARVEVLIPAAYAGMLSTMSNSESAALNTKAKVLPATNANADVVYLNIKAEAAKDDGSDDLIFEHSPPSSPPPPPPTPPPTGSQGSKVERDVQVIRIAENQEDTHADDYGQMI